MHLEDVLNNRGRITDLAQSVSFSLAPLQVLAPLWMPLSLTTPFVAIRSCTCVTVASRIDQQFQIEISFLPNEVRPRFILF